MTISIFLVWVLDTVRNSSYTKSHSCNLKSFFAIIFGGIEIRRARKSLTTSWWWSYIAVSFFTIWARIVLKICISVAKWNSLITLKLISRKGIFRITHFAFSWVYLICYNAVLWSALHTKYNIDNRITFFI